MKLPGRRAPDPAHQMAEELERALDAEDHPELSRRAVPVQLLEPPRCRRLVGMALEEWAMLLGLWTVTALAPDWAYPLLLLPLAGRFHALGVILHEAAHLPLARKTAGARAVELLCGYPIASTLEAMRYHHMRHHRDSGMATDPYYKAGRQQRVWWVLNVARGLLLVPFWSLRALVGVVAYRLRPLREVYARVFLQDRSGVPRRDAPDVIGCARADHGQVAFQLAVAAAALFAPRAVLLGYLVPVNLAGLLAARRLLLEHRYERVGDRRPQTILRTTADNHLGWLGALALAPRNIGFHVVHHLHPQVGLHALPRLREWYRLRYPDIYPPPRN
jgi:fatty acid desaturase